MHPKINIKYLTKDQELKSNLTVQFIEKIVDVTAEVEAAVKGLAWSPHNHGVLASGGGSADKTIKFWNTLNGTMLDSIDTGSQVCNLMFSKTTK
jgi:WD40 repeat protein